MSEDITLKASDNPSDYLIVEDPKKPTTFHLQVKKNGTPDHGLMGGAWAALHSGYRGNKYSGPNKAEAIAKLTKLYASEKIPTPSSKEARSESLKSTIKQFDPDYSQAEAWDAISASAALSQIMQVAGNEAQEQEPEHVAMLGKIGQALLQFISEEIDEMITGEEPAPLEATEVEPAMMEAKTNGFDLFIDKIITRIKQGARHSAADQKNVQAIHDAASALGADCQMQVKQAKDGSWRWLMLSSNAYRDRDKETVSTKALENDCARADADGYYGPLRWWHVGEYDVSTKQAGPGADLGMCDFNAMHGRVLVESGTFKNERVALAVKAASDHLESSIGFFHPLTEPDGEGTFKSIRRFERSLLPKGKAANPLTALTVITQETQTMQKEKLEALKALVGDEEAASIVNQAEVVQKAADAAGLTFKAKEEVAPVAGNTSLKELTDSLAASLAPMIEAKVKEALTAYAQTVETKAAGQQAQIDKLNTAVKALLGDLPRNAARGVIGIESDHNVVDNAKTKEFQPSLNQEQFPLANFTNWITGANPVVPTV